MSDQDKILNKIQNLLNLAEHENTGVEEADAARAMADKMMIKFAIEEHQLAAAGKNQKGYMPVAEEFQFCEPYAKDERSLLEEYYWLITSIAEHNRCRVHGTWSGKATVIGYEADVWMTKIMYTQVRLHMAGKINPMPDVNATYDENVYNLHEAGLIWKMIYQRMNDFAEQGGWSLTLRPNSQRLINAAKRQAKREGVPYVAKSQPHLYRKSYATGYANEIADRLRKMREGSSEEREAGALVLVERKSAVDDMYKEMFPPVEYSKKTRARKYREQKRDWSAMDAGRGAAKSADLTAGKNGMANATRGEIG